MAADAGMHRHEKRQQLRTDAFPCHVEIAVKDQGRPARKTAMAQIHQQEGEVIEHIDAGERAVEFNAVEERRPVAELADVSQMEVPVAEPDLAVPTALLDQDRESLDFGQAIGRKPRDRHWIKLALTDKPHVLLIALDDSP